MPLRTLPMLMAAVLVSTGLLGGAVGIPAAGADDRASLAPSSVTLTTPAIISTIETAPLGYALAVSADDTVYVSGYDDSAGLLTTLAPGTLSGTFLAQVLWRDDSEFLPVGLDLRDDTILVTGSPEDIDLLAPIQRSVQYSILDETIAPSFTFDVTGLVGFSPALAADGCSAVYPNVDDSALYEQCGGPGGLLATDPSAAAVITDDDTVFLAGPTTVQSFTLDDTQTIVAGPAVTDCDDLGSVVELFLSAALLDDSVYYLADCSGDGPGGNTVLGIVDSTTGASSGSIELGEFLPFRLQAGLGRILAPGAAFIVGPDPALLIVDLDGTLERIADPDGGEAFGAVETSTGLIYVGFSRGPEDPTSVAVVDDVTASPVAATGVAGDEFTMTLTTATGSPWFDDMIYDLEIGGRNASWTRSGTTLTITAPTQGSCTLIAPLLCQADVDLELLGENVLTVGTFTYALPPTPDPTPTPPVRASAPTDVLAVGQGSGLEVTWSPPARAGSYPVTGYEVDIAPEPQEPQAVEPGGGTCLTAELTCEVTALEPGTEYAVRVRALTGAGWGAWSDPVSAVTVSLSLRGSMRGTTVRATGASTGLGLGAEVRIWLKRGTRGFAEVRAPVLVDAEGGFTWRKALRRAVPVRVYAEVDGVRSSILRLRPPRR